jgi:hypothetical protein
MDAPLYLNPLSSIHITVNSILGGSIVQSCRFSRDSEVQQIRLSEKGQLDKDDHVSISERIVGISRRDILGD